MSRKPADRSAVVRDVLEDVREQNAVELLLLQRLPIREGHVGEVRANVRLLLERLGELVDVVLLDLEGDDELATLLNLSGDGSDPRADLEYSLTQMRAELAPQPGVVVLRAIHALEGDAAAVRAGRKRGRVAHARIATTRTFRDAAGVERGLVPQPLE